MKKFILFFTSIFIINCTIAQFVVNLGEDIHRCSGENTQLNSEVVGGTPPYSYFWQSLDVDATIDASIMLSNITIANPVIVYDNLVGNPNRFVLTVTDANNMTIVDTIAITTSYFNIAMSPTYPTTFYIEQGDSVWLQAPETTMIDFANGEGGTIEWSPSESLSSAITNYPDGGVWAKPTVSTEYTTRFVDAAGCSHVDQNKYNVVVGISAVEKTELSNLVCYPNPVSGILYFETQDVKRVKVISISGNIILQSEIYSSHINLKNLASGIYFIHVYTDSEVFVSKIIKE